ncbi:MAG: hypothetical protein HOA84_05220, partial [Candidatus Jacksonbacteria bacterium]|nr:hypothetical protein [Candidatus Jacksonbacteria bacterium]
MRMKKILQLLSLKASFVSGLFNDFKAKPWRYLPWTIGFGLLIFIPIDLVFAQESILQNSFFSILNSVLFTIVTVLGKLLVIIIDLMLRIVSYNNFVHEGFVIKGWIVLRDVLNTLFIFFLLMIAFATIFNYESYGYKSLLGKVLLAAILVNFSRTIAGIAIDFSHVFMMVFLNGFKDAAAGNFTKGLGIRDIVQFGTTDPGDISGKEIFGSLVFGIIYLLIAVVTILVYFLMFVLRIIALWFLVITSPVYFVLNAVPFGKQSASQWLKNFSKYLVIGPALAFFLWLSLAAMGTVSQTFHSNLSETGTETSAQLEAGNDQLSAAISKSARPAGLMSYVISIGLLWGSLIYASKSGVAGSQVAGKAMEKMKKFGSSTAKKAGLAPFKHVGGRIARSEGLKKAFDKVGGRGGKLGTALMLTGIRPAAEKLGLKMQENKDKYKKEAEKKVKALSGADMHASLRRRGQQKGGALSPFRVPSMAVRDEIHKKHPEYLNPRDAAKWVSKNRKAKDYNDAGAEAMFVVSEGIKKQRVLSTDPEEIRELQTAENQMGQTAEGTGMRTDVLASLNLDKNRNPIPQLGQLSRFTTVWGAAKARKAQGYSTATEEEQRDLAGGKHYTAVGADAPADDKQFAAGDEPASGDEEKVTSDTDDSDEKEAETTELRDRLDETQYGEKARKRRVPQKKVDNTVAAIKRHDQGIFVDKLAIAESLGYTSSKAAGTAAAQYQQDLDQKGPSEILRRVEGKNIKIRASNKKKKKRDREELLKPGDYMLPSFYESKAFEDDLALPITDRKYVEYDQLRAPTSRHRMTGINKMLRASGEGKQLQSALIAADFAQLGLGEKPAYHTSDKEAMAEAQTAVLRQMAGEGYDRAEMEAVQKQFEGMSSIQMLNKANSVFQYKDRTPVAKIDDEKYEEELDEDGRKIRKKGEDGKPLPFDRYETYTTQEDENRTTSVGFKNTKHVIAEEDMHRRIESLDDGAEEELWDTVKDEDKES